jgi:hypothetical protein
MSLITHLERAGNASLTYFKGLMHAADARLCAENENWAPAAVSLYYAVFDLTIAAMLASEYEQDVDYEGDNLPLSEAIMRGADPYHFISHRRALRFAQQEMDQGFADALVRLHQAREFTSYHPRRTIRPDGTRWVDTCALDAPQFVRRVRQESQRIEEYFQTFRDYLRQQGRANPDHEAYWLADADIEQHAGDPMRELGRYRCERATIIAGEIHAAVFPYAR